MYIFLSLSDTCGQVTKIWSVKCNWKLLSGTFIDFFKWGQIAEGDTFCPILSYGEYEPSGSHGATILALEYLLWNSFR